MLRRRGADPAEPASSPDHHAPGDHQSGRYDITPPQTSASCASLTIRSSSLWAPPSCRAIRAQFSRRRASVLINEWTSSIKHLLHHQPPPSPTSTITTSPHQPPPSPTSAITNLRHHQPPPSPTSAITNLRHHQPPPSPTSAITNLRHHQPPPSPTSAITNLRHHQPPPSPTSAITNLRHHQPPPSPTSAITCNHTFGIGGTRPWRRHSLR